MPCSVNKHEHSMSASKRSHSLNARVLEASIWAEIAQVLLTLKANQPASPAILLLGFHAELSSSSKSNHTLKFVSKNPITCEMFHSCETLYERLLETLFSGKCVKIFAQWTATYSDKRSMSRCGKALKLCSYQLTTRSILEIVFPSEHFFTQPLFPFTSISVAR